MKRTYIFQKSSPKNVSAQKWEGFLIKDFAPLCLAGQLKARSDVLTFHLPFRSMSLQSNILLSLLKPWPHQLNNEVIYFLNSFFLVWNMFNIKRDELRNYFTSLWPNWVDSHGLKRQNLATLSSAVHRFTSFPSGGFTMITVTNPPNKKFVNPTSVQCHVPSLLWFVKKCNNQSRIK